MASSSPRTFHVFPSIHARVPDRSRKRAAKRAVRRTLLPLHSRTRGLWKARPLHAFGVFPRSGFRAWTVRATVRSLSTSSAYSSFPTAGSKRTGLCMFRTKKCSTGVSQVREVSTGVSKVAGTRVRSGRISPFFAGLVRPTPAVGNRKSTTAAGQIRSQCRAGNALFRKSPSASSIAPPPRQ